MRKLAYILILLALIGDVLYADKSNLFFENENFESYPVASTTYTIFLLAPVIFAGFIAGMPEKEEDGKPAKISEMDKINDTLKSK
jgi:hypothetical protein